MSADSPVLDRLVLDHTAVMVADLDRAQEQYARLGFRLTRRSTHRGTLEPEGPVVPWGTGNHCAMFQGGYFELLGITDPNLYHDLVRARLERYAGLHLIALGCDDMDALRGELERRPGVVRRGVNLHRDVPYGEGTKPGRFRLLYIREGLFPEAELFFIQQLTPEVLWQPELLDQPNAVTLLESVTVCSEDPAGTARRFQETTGVQPDTSGEGIRFQLARGAVEMLDPAGLARRFGGARPPALPSLAAVSFGVSDRDRARRCLEGNGVPFTEDDAGILVQAEHAAGAVVRFG